MKKIVETLKLYYPVLDAVLNLGLFIGAVYCAYWLKDYSQASFLLLLIVVSKDKPFDK